MGSVDEDLAPDYVNFNAIENGLYLGNLSAAIDVQTLRTLRISHILTIDSKPLPSIIQDIPGLRFLYVEVNDMQNEDLLSHFPKIVQFIAEGQERGNILVHCYFGVSRSVTAVAAFLMHKYKIQVDEAISKIKSKRRCVGPNSGFLAQLSLYQILGHELDISHNSYKFFQLQCAGENFKRGKSNLKMNYGTMLSCTGSSGENSTRFKCKSCRYLLFTSRSVIAHLQGQSPNWVNPDYAKVKLLSCALGYFVFPCDWMDCFSNPQGKICCPKCNHKIGAFNWIKGYSCPCSININPGFFVIPSKIDVCVGES